MIGADTAEPAYRALVPDERGFAEVCGVRIAYEVFGDGEQTLLLLAPWSIIHSRFWKFQVPYLARHFRVVTFDGRGNGLSDRPESTDEYGPRAAAQDALAVLDAAEAEDGVVVAHCAAAGADQAQLRGHPSPPARRLSTSTRYRASTTFTTRSGRTSAPRSRRAARSCRHELDQPDARQPVRPDIRIAGE